MYVDSGDPISPPGVRDENLLASACSRPATGIGQRDKYKSVYSKAAALFHSLTKNHAFHNGNKRVALACLIVMLARNKKSLRPEVSDNELFEAVVAITNDTFVSGQKAHADIVVLKFAKWIRDRSSDTSQNPSEMKLVEFLKKAKQAGCTVKDSKGSYVVTSPGNKSIRLGKDSNRLNGKVVRKYMKILHLTGSISYDEFEGGVSEEQAQIRRFRRVLDQLGNA